MVGVDAEEAEPVRVHEGQDLVEGRFTLIILGESRFRLDADARVHQQGRGLEDRQFKPLRVDLHCVHVDPGQLPDFVEAIRHDRLGARGFKKIGVGEARQPIVEARLEQGPAKGALRFVKRVRPGFAGQGVGKKLDRVIAAGLRIQAGALSRVRVEADDIHPVRDRLPFLFNRAAGAQINGIQPASELLQRKLAKPFHVSRGWSGGGPCDRPI